MHSESTVLLAGPDARPAGTKLAIPVVARVELATLGVLSRSLKSRERSRGAVRDLTELA